jgi:hypothetical protein
VQLLAVVGVAHEAALPLAAEVEQDDGDDEDDHDDGDDPSRSWRDHLKRPRQRDHDGARHPGCEP